MIIITDFVKNTFPNQETCYRFLEKIRWNDSYPHCVHCNSYNITPRKNELRYQCNECGTIFSILASSVFQGTNVELQKWFIVILLLSIEKKPINKTELSSHLNISRPTIKILIEKITRSLSRDNKYLSDLQDALLQLFKKYCNK